MSKSTLATAAGLALVALLSLASAAGASVDPCCFDDGSCESIRTDLCLEQGGQKLGFQTCSPNPCPQPEGGACATDEQCQEGLQCVEEACRAMTMAPVASTTGLLLLAGGLALVGGIAAKRRIRV